MCVWEQGTWTNYEVAVVLPISSSTDALTYQVVVVVRISPSKDGADRRLPSGPDQDHRPGVGGAHQLGLQNHPQLLRSGQSIH